MKVGYIYKITSPKKRVYIGQSTNIKKRFSHYRRMQCKSQQKLFYSFKKYGVDNHHFEILAECDVIDLNRFERYYQDLFNCISKNGLNLCLVSTEDRSVELSEQTKAKIRISKVKVTEKNKREGLSFFSKEIQKKALQSRLENPRVLSEAAKENLRIKNLGKIKSEATKLKISLSKKGVKTGKRKFPMTQTHKDNILKSKKGKFLGENNKQTRTILNTETGIYYFGAKEAIKSQSVYKNKDHINAMLAGLRNNKTSFIRV